MQRPLNPWLGAAALMAGLVFLPAARAEAVYPDNASTSPVVNPDQAILNSATIPQAFNQGYFRYDPNFFENQTVARQAVLFFNLHTPESEISEDGQVMNAIYHDVLAQQEGFTPPLRVTDLPDPYCTTLNGGGLCGPGLAPDGRQRPAGVPW